MGIVTNLIFHNSKNLHGRIFIALKKDSTKQKMNSSFPSAKQSNLRLSELFRMFQEIN